MTDRTMKIAALLVAAGRGIRAGGETPKQWRKIAGKRMIDWSLAAFANHPEVDHCVVVLSKTDLDRPINAEIVQGGDTRAASVKCGLAALAERGFTHVLIHDAARPCLEASLIDRIIDRLKGANAVAPGLAIADALWNIDGPNVVGGTDRAGMLRAQTPQAFELTAITRAHNENPTNAPDDVAVALAGGLMVNWVEGDETNFKVTTPPDFERAANYLRGKMDIRTGNGFDVHRFCEGASVTLCGVEIAHTQALLGHSDADVGMHALTDAIYGALAQGDIGRHFPPSDPKWIGAASEIFLDHAANLARDMGYAIGNADVTLICEMPKIGPHADAMQAELARIMNVEPSRISVKATTSEQLGFTGRGEGIASIATVSLITR